MLKPLTFCAAVLAAGPAAALSCIAPTIPDTFAVADESAYAFVPALGTLQRTGQNVPDGPDTGDPNDLVGYSFDARFQGSFAGRDSFGAERTEAVTVEVQCVAAWCGGEPPTSHMLYFFRVDPDGSYVFESTVCPLYAFPDPTSHELQSLFGLIQG